jgi:zinc protease
MEVLDRTRPPKPGPLPKVSFPKHAERTLSNGLKVYLVENHEQPIVTTSLYVRAGSVDDPKEFQGLASVVGEMLTKGTARRTAPEIAEEIDFVGGSLSANASWDSTTLSVTILTRYLGKGLDLLADILLNPTFPEEDLERVKLQRIAGLKQAKADAGYLADTVFTKLVFAEHPYGHQAGGTEWSVTAITRDAITKFHADRFGADSAFFVVAGDVDPDSFIASLETLFGGWKRTAQKRDIKHPELLQNKVQVGLVEKEGAVQSAIRIGHLGIERKNEDYTPLYVLNMLLGGYFNSRINLNLREKHGFTYGARSYFDARMETGPFVVSTEVSTGVTVRSVEEILNELRRITAEAITAEELEMVKNYVIGSFPLQIETPQQVASRVATLVLYDLERDYYDTFRNKVAELTEERLLEAARKYLHPDRVSIVVSGDVPSLREPMASFGEVNSYDAEGNKIN